jgi:predicted RND superfamily exporter protein
MGSPGGSVDDIGAALHSGNPLAAQSSAPPPVSTPPPVNDSTMRAWVSRWTTVAVRWEGEMSCQFARLARYSAERPRQMQYTVTLIMLVSCLGYIPWTSSSGSHYGFFFEARPEELWSLEHSELVAGLHWYRENVPMWNQAQTRSMLLTFDSLSSDGEGNVLTDDFLDSAAQMRDMLLHVKTDNGVSYSDVCSQLPPAVGQAAGAMASAPCFVYSYLEFWPPNLDYLTQVARVPCKDIPKDLLVGQLQNAGVPLTLIGFQGCPSLNRLGSMLLTCDSKLPLSLGSALRGDGSGVPLWALCPATCGRCVPSNSTVATVPVTAPVISEINLQSSAIVSDRRALQMIEAERVVLHELCADMPPELLRTTRHAMDAWQGFNGTSVQNCSDAYNALARMVDDHANPCELHLGTTTIDQMVPPQIKSSTPAGVGKANCWGGADTFARCCSTAVSPTGDPSCWSGQHTYRSCCDDGKLSAVELQQIAGYNLAAVCSATCSQHGVETCQPDSSKQNQIVPLVVLNALEPMLQWDSTGLLGRITRHKDSSKPGGPIMQATAVRVFFTMDCVNRRDGDQTDCVALEQKWMETLGAGNFLPWPFNRAPEPSKAVRGDARVRYFTLQGQTDEMLRAIFGTLPLLGLSGLLMIMYIAVALGKRGADRKHSKIFIGMVGNMIVGIGCVTTFGLCCGLGVSITPISQVVPFLMLGIGVDDMFVIVRTLERIPTNLPTADRIELAYRKCGGAIAVTSFTDGLAFLVGATIKFPAMRAFCINAGVGVLIIFTLQLTFMAACLSLSDQAMKGNPTREYRFLNWFRDKIMMDKILDAILGASTAPANIPLDDASVEEAMPSSFVRNLFEKRLGPFVLYGSDAQHRGVLVVFGLLSMLGLYGATTMQRGFPLTDVFCDDSYISDFLRSSSQHFADQAYPFYLIFKDVDYADRDARAEMTRVANALMAIRLDNGRKVMTHPMGIWTDAYTASIYFPGDDTPEKKRKFYSGLVGFLASPEGLQYSQDVAFAPNKESIIGSRFVGFLPGDMLDDSPLHTADAQEEVVEKIKDVTHQTKLDCFVFTFVMLVWEVWTSLVVQMFVNLGQAFVAIAICTSIFLIHPLTALLVTLTVAAVELELAAMCSVLGIQLNTVTVVIFIMNFGLVVDYSAHIAHHFMTTGGTPRERAAHALVEMGSGVFNGAFTTALGMLPLIWAPFETGRVFLQLFAMIIFLGVLHAFLLLPIMLVVTGPTGTGGIEIPKTQQLQDRMPPGDGPTMESG